MFSNRPRNAICCSHGPLLCLFDRHRWHGQCENGTTPYPCERFLVSGFGTPNLHQVASTWPNGQRLAARTVKHFGSWLGLAPHNKISGGKVLRPEGVD
jgi:hypothetical protein